MANALVGEFAAERGAEEYSGAGLSLNIELELKDLEPFSLALRDRTRGLGWVED